MADGAASGRTQIGLLLFPGLTQLDLTGPHEVFARVPDADVHVVWKHLEPVHADSGLQLVPTVTFIDCPRLDVVCVPGGAGTDAMLSDAEVLDWLRRIAAGATFVVSVCAGSLVLGAAGLLRGRTAGCHWASRQLLMHFGATPSRDRVVVDGNLVTGAGVTAGIDVALEVVGSLRDRRTAEAIQLSMEYDPRPPFSAGTPDTADEQLVAATLQRMMPRLVEREIQVRRAGARVRNANAI
jgi:cyclohexyl-isocyanide hydratase